MFFSGYGKAIKEVRFGASKRLLVFVGNGGIYHRAGGTETKKYRNPEKLRYSVHKRYLADRRRQYALWYG